MQAHSFMPVATSATSSILPERWIVLIVRLVFGTVLAFTLQLLCFVVVIPLMDRERRVIGQMMPGLLLITIACIIVSYLLYRWQKPRLPTTIKRLGFDVILGIFIYLGIFLLGCWLLAK